MEMKMVTVSMKGNRIVKVKKTTDWLMVGVYATIVAAIITMILALAFIIGENRPESTVEAIDPDAPRVMVISSVQYSSKPLSTQVMEEVAAYHKPAADPGIFLDVPTADSGQKTFMDHKTITSTTSDQYRLQQGAWTDDLGFRRYGDEGYYMVAMGTYYAEKCGRIFQITLENGSVLDCIIGDVKNDADTDALNQHRNGNVVEFIVDSDRIPDACWKTGSMSSAGEKFEGKISSIKLVYSPY